MRSVTAALDHVLVVGASAAGCAVAEALRVEGYAGTITLAGDEPHLPYDRPPLSKQILKSEWLPDQVMLRAPEQLAAKGIALRMSARAERLDRDRRTILFDDGAELGFDRLVIATGVRARVLTQAPDVRGVHYLRTIDHAIALRDALRSARRVVIIGAGFIGLEVAAVARELDRQVDVVEMEPVPLATKIGALLGHRVEDLHTRHGVRFHLGDAVERIESRAGAVSAVILRSGKAIAADAVLIGIGTATNDGWLESSGLDIRNGVRCDAYCAAAPNIWAAGDIANFDHRALGRHIRIEHRSNAAEQGVAVARNMLGHREPYLPLPFFWSRQFDANIQMFGAMGADADPQIVDADPGRDRFVALYHAQGELVGALGWNAPRQIAPYRQALAIRYRHAHALEV